ncbi:ImmA/IrrE family metallo-endopeptidase [Lacticaseibacillus paracasei]|uniref:ImmA/IrrE family metallo-endopeptidase n=1 Tax=Lacticaseibacillus paracasei TaxID=1597 RepID=UPI00236215C1|nr:ImmA/IrrE family metallo-endopeptidase [Lacticaseibacillus paracasei]
MMTDFTSDMLREVLNYGFDRGVGAELTYKLKPYTPSVSNPETRWIAVNMNWHEPKQLPYQAAHEIMHVLHQDPACLYFYSASKNSIEGEANIGGIHILVPLYFTDIDKEDANLNQFMKAFDIPASMEDAASEAIKGFYI